MQIDDVKLKEILVRENYVSAEDIAAAESYAREHHVSLAERLLAESLVTKDLLGQAVAESLGVPYADLNSNQPPREQVLAIPEAAAKRLRAVLFQADERRVVIATDAPMAPGLHAELEQLFPGKYVSMSYALPEDVDASFVFYQKPLETRFSKIITAQTRVAPELLEEIFEDASVFHASDIHFEPQPQDVLVRFRVDGVLHEAGRVPKEHYENILNRIKVQSRLRIDEHFSAQDGSIRYQKGDNSFDLRTSIVPTVEGEKVVLRVLGAYVQGFTLGDIGLSPEHQQAFEEAARKPFGMILVVGPTGSGKTTTLYALLKLLNRPEVNITTIEDPVEYKVRGMNQIQVNPQTNLTFAKGLRSIVRQDPDIILVGEIRDEETAEIALNAALTGHLLFSTFHANDAATAIPRLLDMKIEPFLLASTLELVVAQRLVRRICEACRVSASLGREEIAHRFAHVAEYFPEKSVTLYAGKGCTSCGGTGYRGRTAIFEFIRVTRELEELILHHPSTQQVAELARAHGEQPLFEDGVEKVKSGVTTLEELLRVAQPEDAHGRRGPHHKSTA